MGGVRKNNKQQDKEHSVRHRASSTNFTPVECERADLYSDKIMGYGVNGNITVGGRSHQLPLFLRSNTAEKSVTLSRDSANLVMVGSAQVIVDPGGWMKTKRHIAPCNIV